MEVDGELVETATGAAVLGHPAEPRAGVNALAKRQERRSRLVALPAA